MRFIKPSVCIFALTVLLGSAPSFAMMIGVQFAQAGPALLPDEVAGVVPQAGFNVIIVASGHGTSGLTLPLAASDGTATPVTLEHISNDGFNSNTGTTTANGALLHGEDKSGPEGGGPSSGPGESAVYVFQNVPAGNYNLIAYTEDERSGVNANLTVGSTTYYIVDEQVSNGTLPPFLLADSTDPDVRTVGNYVEFMNVSPKGGVINLTNTSEGGGNDDAAINGIQLIQTDDTELPEPRSLGLASCIGLMLLRRRAKRVA
jgi:hypothetical protein